MTGSSARRDQGALRLRRVRESDLGPPGVGKVFATARVPLPWSPRPGTPRSSGARPVTRSRAAACLRARTDGSRPMRSQLSLQEERRMANNENRNQERNENRNENRENRNENRENRNENREQNRNENRNEN